MRYAVSLSENGCRKGVATDFVSVDSNSLWTGLSYLFAQFSQFHGMWALSASVSQERVMRFS